MSVARWAVRLPRSTALTPEARQAPRAFRRIDQRRWLTPRPPPRARPWASTGKSNAEDPEQALQRTQKSYGADRAQQQHPQTTPQEQPPVDRTALLSSTLAEADSSDLVAEVHIPNDPNGVLSPDHPALSILGNSSLVIQRRIEMMNIIIGMEQANYYTIMDGQGQMLGSIAELDNGIGRSMVRQFAKTHRSFTTHIFDVKGREVLRIHRPFAFINSRIRIYDAVPPGGYESIDNTAGPQTSSTIAMATTSDPLTPQPSPLKLEEMRIIGEAQQEWAPLRRKYNLFAHRPGGNLLPSPDQSATPDPNTLSQFAHISEPFLSWDFTLKSESEQTIGSVNRNFGGFAREIFTDTGAYALRMDSAAQTSAVETADGKEVMRLEREGTAMTLDQRAVMLATAVSIDFDYFSRHSSHSSGMGFMPIWWPFGGGGAAAEGAGAAGAGAAGGAIEGGAIEGVAGAAGRGLGTGTGAAGEGAIAGAGTMAGYEAMQRGAYGPRGGDDASPRANDPYNDPASPGASENSPGNDTWGEGQDPWGGGGGGDDDMPPPDAGGGGEGGGWGDVLGDFFGSD